MSEPNERIHTSNADQGPDRIKDPSAGLDRLKEALRRILKVPKSAIENGESEAGDPKPT